MVWSSTRMGLSVATFPTPRAARHVPWPGTSTTTTAPGRRSRVSCAATTGDSSAASAASPCRAAVAAAGVAGSGLVGETVLAQPATSTQESPSGTAAAYADRRTTHHLPLQIALP